MLSVADNSPVIDNPLSNIVSPVTTKLPLIFVFPSTVKSPLANTLLPNVAFPVIVAVPETRIVSKIPAVPSIIEAVR